MSLTASLTPGESVITNSTDSHPTPSQSLIGTVRVTTNPIPNLTTVPTSGTESTDIILIAGIVAGTFVGLIILILAIVIAVWSCCFKCHCPLKSNPNKPIELVKYQNAVGEAAVDGDNESYSNDSSFFEPEYQPTADETYQNVDSCTDHVPNPIYSSSVTEGLYESVPTGNTCGGDNVHAAIPNEPTPLLPKQCLDQLGKAKTKFDHALPIYSDVQKSTPCIPPKSSDLINYLASQDDVPAMKMNHDSMQLGYTNERSDSLSFQAVNQPMNITHPTSSDGCHTVQPTLFPPEEIIYDNVVSPPAFRDGDDQESMKEKEVECDPSVHAPIYDDPKVLPKDLQQPMKVTNDNIKEIRELGNGHFGQVMLAATQGLSLKDMQLSKTDDNRDASILVAVKKLIDHPSKTQRESFIKEAKFMSSLNHQNVVRLIGVCYDEPAFMMMEYMEEGDLNEFLQQYSEIVETPSNDTQISTSTVVYMASQIASAMKYLASLNFIHRDIASRNCLVGSNFSVKLADFGMSRNLYESHYYRIQGKTSVPVRWMATECFYGLFTEKSDVWAFGVTMWELFILAKKNPYPNLSNEELINDVAKGAHRQLLPRPSVCPIPVYNIMRRCWAIDPEKRANFEEVEEMLQSYMTST